MYHSKVNSFYDGKRKIVFHKSPLVELFASLHSMQTDGSEKNESLWLAEGRIKKMDSEEQRRLNYYGRVYAKWSLIMDLATYISCQYHKETGETEISFNEAIKRFHTMDNVTFLFFFLGMPALGLTIENAREWLNNPEKISLDEMKPVNQYIKYEDAVLFIKKIDYFRDDLVKLIKSYWNTAFSDVWNDIEKNITKAIDRNIFKCSSQSDCIQYISNLHNDIYVMKGKIYLTKEINYVIPVDDIKQIHVFPSTFSNPELLMDRFGESLVIYYNMNLKTIKDELGSPEEISESLKALCDGNRLRILKLIWGAPATTQYISNVLGLAQSTVSAHLKVLKTAGFVNSKTVKRYVYYEVDMAKVQYVFTDFIEYIRGKA